MRSIASVCSLLLPLVLYTNIAFSQTVKRLDQETPVQFVKRFTPAGSSVTHQVIEAKWNTIPVIIAFYDQIYRLPKANDPDQEDFHRIIGTIYYQLDSNSYARAQIDTFDTEGGDPVIESVFFANADRDPGRELIAIVSWEQNHADVNGKLYGTYVFDDLSVKEAGKLKLLKDISNRLAGDCECSWSDGTSKKVKFKTAKNIRAELQRLGYK
jgi:hypothetical protein